MSSETSLFNFSPDERREYESATLRFTAAAHIQNYMDQAGLQAKDLAHRIRKSRAWVSKLLNGRQNATLDTLADAAWALGARWKIDLVPAERVGTPAESDPPAPYWAASTTVTAIGENLDLTSHGIGLIALANFIGALSPEAPSSAVITMGFGYGASVGRNFATCLRAEIGATPLVAHVSGVESALISSTASATASLHMSGAAK